MYSPTDLINRERLNAFAPIAVHGKSQHIFSMECCRSTSRTLIASFFIFVPVGNKILTADHQTCINAHVYFECTPRGRRLIWENQQYWLPEFPDILVYCALELLKEGYDVRGTLRSLSKGPKIVSSSKSFMKSRNHPILKQIFLTMPVGKRL